MKSHRTKPKLGLAAFLAAVTLMAAGCSSAPAGTPTGTPSEGVLMIDGQEVAYNQELADMLPEDIQDKGVLSFSTDAAGPPRTFVDESGEIVGVIPDLLQAIGATLGVEIDLQKNSFDAEVPGVQSGRFDSTTGTGDFPSRREVLDLVDYYRAGFTYLVQAGNPKDVTADELSNCGLRVGVLKGTTQETMAADLSARCVAEGLDPIDLQSFSNVLLPVPLESDRIDVAWENTSTGLMVAEESPEKFEVAATFFLGYVAFGVLKDRTELRDTLQATVQHLLDEGVYQAIFDKWGQGDLVMDYISVNSDNRDEEASE